MENIPLGLVTRTNFLINIVFKFYKISLIMFSNINFEYERGLKIFRKI